MATFMTYFKSDNGEPVTLPSAVRAAVQEVFPTFRLLKSGVWVFESDEKEMAVQHLFRTAIHQRGLPPKTAFLSPVDLSPEKIDAQARWAPEALVLKMAEARSLLSL